VKVLIIDDSLTVRMDLADALGGAGFDVRLAASAAAAREIVAEWPVELILLDVVLPDGDGVELLAELRRTEHGAHAAIVMLSSESEVRDRVRALETGADEYVAKPYDRGFIIAKARELRRKRNPSAPGVCVLVIDDSVTFRTRVGEALQAAGYRTIYAATGEEGLRSASEHRPDAIIVDGVMPGIDGATVIRHVRLDAVLRRTPCVLLTASDEPGAELRALDAGADAFVRKDVELDVIIARLAAVMRTADPAGESGGDSLLDPHAVLAVGDAPEQLESIAAALREDALDVAIARDGEQAIAVLAVQRVDCVVIALRDFGALVELCRRLRNTEVIGDLPVVAVTARDDRNALLDALAAGADDCMAATSDLTMLRAHVRAQLRRKQIADENRRTREEKLLAAELERQNRELDAFSYSVAHDLRAPLRSISGFSAALAEDYAPQLDERANDYIRRVQQNARRMAELIDALLELAKIGRAELRKQTVDLAIEARSIIGQLRDREPNRSVDVVIPEQLVVEADRGLARALLDNLLGNAWKFTSKRDRARIELGELHEDGERVIFVRDNGAGFDPAHAAKLFRAFQRLHAATDYEGTGIGLATVHRIVSRHGGRVWAHGEPGAGATFYFTL
jgi:DNA-binding response OmpR family regulator